MDTVNRDSPTMTPADLQIARDAGGPTRRCTSPSPSVRCSTSTTGGSTPAASMPCRTRPTAREASARRRTDTCGVDAAYGAINGDSLSQTPGASWKRAMFRPEHGCAAGRMSPGNYATHHASGLGASWAAAAEAENVRPLNRQQVLRRRLSRTGRRYTRRHAGRFDLFWHLIRMCFREHEPKHFHAEASGALIVGDVGQGARGNRRRARRAVRRANTCPIPRERPIRGVPFTAHPR